MTVKNCGIYKWTNLITNKAYIGQSKKLSQRYLQFLNFDKDYSGSKINKARRKYRNPKYWSYEILEYCNPEQLNDKEISYIKLYESIDKGYNMTEGGSNPTYQKALSYWWDLFHQNIGTMKTKTGTFLMEIGKNYDIFLS